METKTQFNWQTSRDAVPEGVTQVTVYDVNTGNRVATVFNAEAVRNLEQRAQLFKEANALERDMKALRELLWENERKEKIMRLKALKPLSSVWCTRNSVDSQIQYGERGIKTKDGRDYMLCSFGGKSWRVPYFMLSDSEPQDIETNRQLTKIISKI